MLVPGSNILNMALTALGKQTFFYRAYLERETNAIGLDVAEYAHPVRVLGSAQPAPRELIAQMGLEMQRDYMQFYLSRAVIDVTRDVSGSLFEFDGKTYQALSKTNWLAIDGWVSVLCVLVPKKC